MEKPVKNVYRVVDQNTHNVANVVAESQSAAVAFLGLTHVLSVVEVAHAVEIVGADTQHPRGVTAPPPPVVVPKTLTLTNEEVDKVHALLAKG